jgi:hypothetical protein
MLAKRFLYVCLGLLCLLATFEIGATAASGQTAGFRVIGVNFVVAGETVYHLDTLNLPVGWHALPEGSLDLPPVPASSLVSYNSGTTAITDQGEGWGKVNGSWADLGPVPGISPIHPTTWGQLKVKYSH